MSRSAQPRDRRWPVPARPASIRRSAAFLPPPALRGCCSARSELVSATVTLPARSVAVPTGKGQMCATASHLVINHVAGPAEAMRQMQRVASANGRVITTIWDSDPSPLRTLWTEIVQAGGADSPPPDHLAPEHDFDRSVDGLADLHARSGSNVLHSDVLEWDWRIATSDLWRAVEHGLAGIGRLYLHNPPATRNVFRQAFEDITRDMADEARTCSPRPCRSRARCSPHPTR